jgi:hypothetical protein
MQPPQSLKMFKIYFDNFEIKIKKPRLYRKGELGFLLFQQFKFNYETFTGIDSNNFPLSSLTATV